jgi:hypothetical protein
MNKCKHLLFILTRALYRCVGFCVGLFKRQPIKTANEWAAKVDTKENIKRIRSATNKRHPLN